MFPGGGREEKKKERRKGAGSSKISSGLRLVGKVLPKEVKGRTREANGEY